MKEKDMLALLGQVLADAMALKRGGKRADVQKIAQNAAAGAEKRARSAKVLAAVEASMQAERGRFVAVAMQGQRGKGLHARSIESREENSAYREHVRNGGIRKGEDSERQTVRYTAQDAAKLDHDRKRNEGEEVSDETLMRRIDSLSTKGSGSVKLSGDDCDSDGPVTRGCICSHCIWPSF